MDELKEYQKNITFLQYTINILSWELYVSSPVKSKDYLIDTITRNENELFKLISSPVYGNLLEKAIHSKEFSILEDAEKRYIYYYLRKYKLNEKIPSDFFSKYTELKRKSSVVWEKAKEENNYELFKPYLKSIIEMTKKYYGFLNEKSEKLYDVMLNQYETGMTSVAIDTLFNQLKESLIPLIAEQNNKLDKKEYSFSKEQLLDCASFLLEYIGFDMDKGTIALFAHGFTEKMNPNDVRIAFRKTNNPFDFVSTIIHEGGHGLFEQNIKSNLAFYENACIKNLYALHESQSRFYENILGRNINFWIPIYDKVKEILNLDLTLEEFVNNLNISAPGLIRTRADELTYCMHIILRYEVEKEIFDNNYDLDKLPELWNKKMKDYLGVDVDCDANGLMQDIHWSEGDFGYFPSYLLGTIYDGMFMKAIERDLGNIDNLLKQGRIKDITNYLIKNIYCNGGAYTSMEVIEKMYGKELSSEPIIEYFQKKYTKDKKIFKY